MKRLIIAILGGMGCGLICIGLISGSPEPVLSPVLWQAFASRTLIGFAIGISSLRLGHWSIHGIVLGLLFSLPLAFSGLMAPENPEYSRIGMFSSTVVLGAIYGLLIELVTSVAFKARQT